MFCAHCGARVKAHVHVPVTKPVNSERNCKIGLLLMLVGLVAIILLVLTLIRAI